jgi:uncharacterized membrane protein YfcA
MIEYYRHGNLDVNAAFIVTLAWLAGGWDGAVATNQPSGPHVQSGFGIFVAALGISSFLGCAAALVPGKPPRGAPSGSRLPARNTRRLFAGLISHVQGDSDRQ